MVRVLMSVGVMTIGVMSVGEITVGVTTIKTKILVLESFSDRQVLFMYMYL
jgi:hypothetical protein